MLRNLFPRTFKLAIGGYTYSFRTPTELDLILNARTGLSPRKIAALMDLPADELAREAEKFGKVEQLFAAILAQTPGEGDGIGQVLRDLDLTLVSEDNQWREIFSHLCVLDEGYEDYKRAALAKYIQYLNSARKFVKNISPNPRPPAPAPVVEQEAGSALMTDPGSRQLLIFNLRTIATIEQNEEKFARVEKGKLIEIQMAPHQSLSLMLARYRFTLVSGEPFLLLDDTGSDARLRPGRNLIGRDVRSEVIVEPCYRAVSRKHLVVETNGSGLVKLTDFSTLGTFIPAVYLDKMLH